MGGSSTTVQKNDPWGPAQPFILEGLQSASGMWNADPNMFVIDPWMGSSVAREDPALQAARDAMGGYSYQGPPTPQLPDLRSMPSPSTPAPPTPAEGGGVTPPWERTGWPTPNQFSSATGGSAVAAPTTAVKPASTSGPNTLPPPVTPTLTQQPSAGSFVDQQKQLAGQSQYGVNQLGQIASQNPLDPRFLSGLNTALGVAGQQGQAQTGKQVNQSINVGMRQGNDPRFNRAISNMTGDGYDQQLRNQLRENVAASVMPGMNATFANSGMTGSGLHQQNLAKGLSAGMANAEAEFLNRAQDRQFQAGMAGQSALEAARQRALGAGGLALNAGESLAKQQLLGAQLGLDAGTMAQQAGMDNREQALRAFGMNNQMQQGAYNPYLQQQAVGEARTRDAQQQLAADIMANQQAQAGPIDAINNYMGLGSSLGQYGQSATTSRQNPGLFGILGGLGQMLPFF